MVPPVVHDSVIFDDPPAVTAFVVRFALSLESVIAPEAVVTVVKETAPPPDWSKVMEPVPVVRELTATAATFVLLISMFPPVESAVTVVAARLSAVALPMPETALRSTVVAVTVPAPLRRS